MIIAVPKEVKDHEARMASVPSGVTALREAVDEVIVQSAAAEVWSKFDLVIKVKEPQPSEYKFLRPGLTLFTYLHLGPLPEALNGGRGLLLGGIPDATWANVLGGGASSQNREHHELSSLIGVAA